MKKIEKQINFYKYLLILVGIIVFLLSALTTFSLRVLDFGFFNYIGGSVGKNKQFNVNYIKKNQKSLEHIFEHSFEKAETCNNWEESCKFILASDIQSVISTKNLPSGTSTYFIKTGENNAIKKLFLSGDYTVKPATTSEEKKVYNYLKGKRKFLNLYSWKLDATDSNMIYLKDFYSEAEIILPVRKNNTIIGAMVIVHGD